MVFFGRRRSDNQFELGRPGVIRATESGIELLCPSDKHLLADVLSDGTLRIWDRRCKVPFTFDLAGRVPTEEKERIG